MYQRWTTKASISIQYGASHIHVSSISSRGLASLVAQLWWEANFRREFCLNSNLHLKVRISMKIQRGKPIWSTWSESRRTNCRRVFTVLLTRPRAPSFKCLSHRFSTPKKKQTEITFCCSQTPRHDAASIYSQEVTCYISKTTTCWLI